MESLLLAIAAFLSSPAGQDPNREPMWFDGCVNIVEEQIDSLTWYYYCGDIITAPKEEQVESNEEVQQFSFFKEAKGGQKGFKKRPGAKRTDNVKKAIANAALIKSKHPQIYYVIYFSSMPKSGSYSDEMINTALENKIVDEVRYERDVTYLFKQMGLILEK